MFKNYIIICFLGMLAIILGAFGAHALKESLTAVELLSFETAVRYQMYHVIVLLFVNMYAGFSAETPIITNGIFVRLVINAVNAGFPSTTSCVPMVLR